MQYFTQIHQCGHLYRSGGGEDHLNLAPFLEIYEIARTVDMPGFVDEARNVTYQSHHFWLHLLRYRRRRTDAPMPRDHASALVVVHHGAGWEVWRANHSVVQALEGYSGDPRGLYHLCRSLIDVARSNMAAGSHKEGERYRQAFADGRLRKRKMPGRNAVKIWIEPATEAAKAAA